MFKLVAFVWGGGRRSSWKVRRGCWIGSRGGGWPGLATASVWGPTSTSRTCCSNWWKGYVFCPFWSVSRQVIDVEASFLVENSGHFLSCSRLGAPTDNVVQDALDLCRGPGRPQPPLLLAAAKLGCGGVCPLLRGPGPTLHTDRSAQLTAQATQ